MRDEFVPVKSEDELRPGMCVELRPARITGKTVRYILLKSRASRLPEHGKLAWTTVPENAEWKWTRLGLAIRERRLYRMRDDDTAADETATTKRRTQDA